MVKLGDLLRATLYSACPQGWLNIREERNVSVASQQDLRTSCYKFCLALQSFRGDQTGRHLWDINVARDMSPSSARP